MPGLKRSPGEPGAVGDPVGPVALRASGRAGPPPCGQVSVKLGGPLGDGRRGRGREAPALLPGGGTVPGSETETPAVGPRGPRPRFTGKVGRTSGSPGSGQDAGAPRVCGLVRGALKAAGQCFPRPRGRSPRGSVPGGPASAPRVGASGARDQQGGAAGAPEAGGGGKVRVPRGADRTVGPPARLCPQLPAEA